MILSFFAKATPQSLLWTAFKYRMEQDFFENWSPAKNKIDKVSFPLSGLNVC